MEWRKSWLDLLWAIRFKIKIIDLLEEQDYYKQKYNKKRKTQTLVKQVIMY